LKIGTAEEIFGTAEEILGTAEEIFGTAEEIFGTVSVKIVTASVKIGIAAVKIGTAAVKIGVAAVKFGTASVKIGTASVKIGTAAVKIGTAAVKIGTAEEKIGTAEEKIGTAEEKIGTAEEIFETAVGSGDGRLFEESRWPEDKHGETEVWRWPFLVLTVKFISAIITFPSTLPRFFLGGGAHDDQVREMLKGRKISPPGAPASVFDRISGFQDLGARRFLPRGAPASRRLRSASCRTRVFANENAMAPRSLPFEQG
jgi:hypothetical protein